MSKKKSKQNKSIKETALAIAKAQTPEQLISQAILQKVDVGTMERLLAMRKEIRAEKAQEAYVEAMSKFQAECPIINKTKPVLNKDKTPRYKYAPLEDIIRQTRGFIQKNGFSYTLDADVEVGWVTAICKITHELGHSETSKFKAQVDTEAYMNAPQKYASALTFGKRYAFCNAFGILTGDEDNDAVSYEVKNNNIRDVKSDAISPEARFENTKKFIEKTKSADVLVGMAERLNEQDFTKEQKKTLNALISNKVDSLDVQKNK